MQIVDFQALRVKADLERKSRLRVLTGGEREDAAVLALPSALKRWAADQVGGLLPDPDPGPSAA